MTFASCNCDFAGRGKQSTIRSWMTILRRNVTHFGGRFGDCALVGLGGIALKGSVGMYL